MNERQTADALRARWIRESAASLAKCLSGKHVLDVASSQIWAHLEIYGDEDPSLRVEYAHLIKNAYKRITGAKLPRKVLRGTLKTDDDMDVSIPPEFNGMPLYLGALGQFLAQARIGRLFEWTSETGYARHRIEVTAEGWEYLNEKIGEAFINASPEVYYRVTRIADDARTVDSLEGDSSPL